MMFDAIDVDNTGFITNDEFISTLKSISKLPNDALVRFLEIDDDQTGKISFSEFLSAILRASGKIDESILINAFHTMDPSGTGFINVSDLCDLWQDITVEESREMLYDVIGHHEMAEPMLTQRQFIDAFSVKGKNRTSWLSKLIG
jgi:Ca2+-binding EF-hand superfamily protein